MDEEISIIDSQTRNEKIKKFLAENKKIFLITISILLSVILTIYSYQIYNDRDRELLSNKYNSAIIEHKNGNNSKTIYSLREVIESTDSTYSPLALYFIIDNNLIKNQIEVNNLFDTIINKTPLEDEIKNLIIYKKGLYNADFVNENELLKILSPLINSKSVWKSHALYLAAEFFYSKNEKQKSIDFFNQILNTENANQDIIQEAKKRLNRDLSE